MRYQILTNLKEIEVKLKRLTLIRTADEGWTSYYKSDKDFREWCKFHIETEYHGQYQPILLSLPEPSQIELINYLLESSDPREVATLSSLLFYNERDRGLEFREVLISRLEHFTTGMDNKWPSEIAKKINSIINESNLFDNINQRSIVGKSIKEIGHDQLFYEGIALRAKKLLNAANQR